MLDVELRVERGGEFEPKFLDWQEIPKCDLPAAHSYHYHAYVIASDQKLDQHGFVIDNSLIHEHMQTLFNGMPQISCERMASHAARTLYDKIKATGVIVVCVEVKIGGSNGAWITARCKHVSASHLSMAI